MANIIDRIVGYVSPRAALQRERARIAAKMLDRHYEGASSGRRTDDWVRSNSDANAASSYGLGLAGLRATANDLVRNNGIAESAVNTICDHWVGTGIIAKPRNGNKRTANVWKRWAETTACDADGRNNIYGLQKLVARTVTVPGECLVRRRMRRPEDGLPIPMQVQVLEPDHIDTSKSAILGVGGAGGRIVQGVEFDGLGRRRGYWLFSEHPGSLTPVSNQSYFVPAESVLHVFKQLRPGQVRGVSWFAPVMLTFKDYDKLADATLMKQLVSACLAIVTTDVNGEAQPLGSTTSDDPLVDRLEPGLVINAATGRDIKVVNPPTVSEYGDFERSTLRRIATGLGVNYEDLTGDYGMMPFSAARLSRLRHWARVDDWRWRTLIPQFCDPVWRWAMDAAVVMGYEAADAEWTAPPAPMVDPQTEGLAYARNIRSGIQSLSEVLRERGYDPEAVLHEMADDNAMLDDLGLILDSDARNTTQSGGPRYYADPNLTEEQVKAAELANAKAKKELKSPTPTPVPVASPVQPQIPQKPQPAK